MEDYENVECKRCGNRWYSEKFEEDNDLPSACPKCYQEEVRKIPEPPTKVDLIKEDISRKREEIPKQVSQKRHDLIIWKENNRFLISMIEMSILLLTLVGGVTYLLFLA